ncbi:MAG: TetR/AcrR family transcriptional regulator [Phenylobacterium zucineum]|nr:MAG: TetR/AcrR family transcriptional regulator [Phenylobacterium zucineum]
MDLPSGEGVEALRQAARATGDAPVGRREAGKAERRLRIIHAARDLIRETGNAGLSMRALAARAGVSLATPYNLFGSKRAIILAVLEDVRAFQVRFAGLEASDPLARLFASINIAVEFYVADPPFYRTLWSAVFDASDDVRTQIYSAERDAFSHQLVAELAQAGVVPASTDVGLLRRVLDRNFAAAMLEWVMGELPADHLAPSIRYAYALVLKSLATPEWQAGLAARAAACQAELSAS